MTYWDDLLKIRSISRVQQFDLSDKFDVMLPLIKSSTYFLVTLNGIMFDRDNSDEFMVTAAPAHASWDIEMRGAAHRSEEGRLGHSHFRADGTPYGISTPYIPRPNFSSPAILAFYSELPIWGSARVASFASDFIPSQMWLANDRFMRIICKPDESRGQRGSRAELIIDLLHKFAIYYAINYDSAPPSRRMLVRSAAIVVNPESPEIVEKYSD